METSSQAKRGNQGSRSSWPEIGFDSTLAIGNRQSSVSGSRFAPQKLKTWGPINLLTKGPSNQNKTHTAKRGLAPRGGEAGLLAHLNIDMIPILFTNLVEGGVEWSGEEAGGGAGVDRITRRIINAQKLARVFNACAEQVRVESSVLTSVGVSER